jgi:hypothetical protein
MEGKDFKANNNKVNQVTINGSPTKGGAGMASSSSPRRQAKSTNRPSSSMQPTKKISNSDGAIGPRGLFTITTSTQPNKSPPPITSRLNSHTNKFVPTVAATVSQRTSKRQSELLLQGSHLITQYLSNHLRSVALGPSAPSKPPISLETLPFSHIDPTKATESDRRAILLGILDLLEESCVGVGSDDGENTGTGSHGTIGRMGEQGEYNEAVLNAKSLIINLLQLSV